MGFSIEDPGDLCLHRPHLPEHGAEIDTGDRVKDPEVVQLLYTMDQPGYIVHRADRHTAGMEALATDPVYPPALDEADLFSRGCQPDRCQPSCRPPSEDDDHARTFNSGEDFAGLSGNTGAG